MSQTDEERQADSPPATADPLANGEIPHGNLFSSPKLTSLDPADKAERESIERLLESLSDHR